VTRKAKPQSIRSVVAAASGNALEWFDFTVYGFLAPQIGKLFFPEGDTVTATLSAFAVLAVGYAARPVGSVIFGHVGDRFGRKPALMASVLIMGLASLAIGLLPTYAAIGIAAPILLVALRIVQGIAVAGEYAASGILTVEQAPPGRKAFIGGWIAFAMMIGCVLGAAVPAAVNSVLSAEQVADWGWRIPFLLGSVVGVTISIFRRHISESRPASGADDEGESPVITVLRFYPLRILRMSVLLIPTAIIYFVIFVYAVSYLTDEMHESAARALDITTINLIVIAALAPAFGWLADRIGLRPIFLASAIATLVFAGPFWWLMHRPDLGLVFLGQFGLSLLNAAGWALSITALTLMAPAAFRCSSVAVSYNACMAIFGGTTPAVATYLVSRTGDDFAPIYYILIATLVSLPVILRLPKSSGRAGLTT